MSSLPSLRYFDVAGRWQRWITWDGCRFADVDTKDFLVVSLVPTPIYLLPVANGCESEGIFVTLSPVSDARTMA